MSLPPSDRPPTCLAHFVAALKGRMGLTNGGESTFSVLFCFAPAEITLWASADAELPAVGKASKNRALGQGPGTDALKIEPAMARDAPDDATIRTPCRGHVRRIASPCSSTAVRSLISTKKRCRRPRQEHRPELSIRPGGVRCRIGIFRASFESKSAGDASKSFRGRIFRRGSMAAGSAVETGSSTAARYEALIRISNSIHARNEPQDLFEILVHELGRVVPFEAIAQFDESAFICGQCSEWGTRGG